MKIIKDFLLILYQRIAEKVPEIVHKDEYRNQLRNLEKDYPVDYPALIIQILPIDWQNYESKSQQGAAIIRLHIAQINSNQSQYESPEITEHLSRHDLAQKVYIALQGFKGLFFTALKRVSSQLDEDPDSTIIDTIDFETILTDDSEQIADDAKYTLVNPDLIASKQNYLNG